MVYRHQIDEDGLHFAQSLAPLNNGYAPAYVMDICQTEEGLRLLETNCINATGCYAAALSKLAKTSNALA